MTSDDVTCAQAAAIGKVVVRQLDYLYRLRTRMERRGFPPADPLYAATAKAYDAMLALRVHLHYASIPSGVAKDFTLPVPSVPPTAAATVPHGVGVDPKE